MKKAILILALLSGSLAQAQNADPFINVLVSPATIQQFATGVLDVTVANPGNSAIAANSLEVTLTAGASSEILGFDIVNVSDPRWTLVSMTAGSNNTVVLRNNAPLGAGDGGEVYFQLRGNAVSPASTVSGTVSYLATPNPVLGDAPGSVQGNGQTSNDVSTSALTITPVIPLPIGQLSFTGEAAGCEALLRWTTGNEQAVDHYEIEAGDGRGGFTSLGNVPAKAGSSNRYEFRTAQPAGKTHYRLKMVGSDASVRYSQTVAVMMDCGQTALQVFPNPATSQVTVSGLATGDRLALYDLNGKMLRDISAAGATERLDLSTLPAGSYTLLVSGSRQEARKISVVR